MCLFYFYKNNNHMAMYFDTITGGLFYYTRAIAPHALMNLPGLCTWTINTTLASRHP